MISKKNFATALGILLIFILPGVVQGQEKSFTDNFSFEAKPVISSDYLKQDNFKYLSPDNYNGLLERGFYKLSKGSIDEAILDFESVATGAPHYGGGYYGIAMCYKVKGDSVQAENFFMKSISKDVTFGPSYLELGDLTLFKKPAVAEQRYKAAMSLMPESAEPLYRLSIIALNKKDVKTAKIYLKKTMALEPDHLPANLIIGQFLFSEKKV